MSASDEVSECMKPDVVTVEADDSLCLAAEKMHLFAVGGLPVTDDKGNLIGMLTERDICRSVSKKNGKMGNEIVRDWMSAPAIAVQVEETLDGVINRMADYNFRRIPIVSGTTLVGIISQTDMMKHYPDLVISQKW